MADNEFNLKEYLHSYSDAPLDEFAMALLTEDGATNGLDEYLTIVHKIGANMLLVNVGDDRRAQILFTVTMMGQIVAALAATAPGVRDDIKHLLTEHNEILLRIVSLALACGIGLSVKEEWR